jgi:hypothetical protein
MRITLALSASPWLALASEIVLFLQQDEPMCISETVEQDQLLEVHAEALDPVVKGAQQQLKVQILDPTGKDVFHETRQTVLSAFSTYSAGDYHACGTAMSGAMRVRLDVRTGSEANSFSNAQERPKGEEEKVDRLIAKTKQMLMNYHKDIAVAKTRAEKTMEVHNKVAVRLIWSCFMTVVLTMVVSGYQVTHIKHYFRGRKVL